MPGSSLDADQSVLSDRSHRYAIFVLAAVLALDGADRTALGALAPALKAEFHIGNTEIGLLATGGGTDRHMVLGAEDTGVHAGSTSTHDFRLKTDDGANRHRQITCGVRVKLGKPGQIDIWVAGEDEAHQCFQLGFSNCLSLSDLSQGWA